MQPGTKQSPCPCGAKSPENSEAHFGGSFHFAVPFQLCHDPGQSVCSLPHFTPYKPFSKEIKSSAVYSKPSPRQNGVLSGCLPSQEQRLEEPLLWDTVCLLLGWGSSGPWLGLDLTLVSCPWEQWFRGVSPSTPTKDGK